MIKSIRDNCKIYGSTIVKIAKKSLMLDYGFSNATFETPNHDLAHVAFLIMFLPLLKITSLDMTSFLSCMYIRRQALDFSLYPRKKHS